MRILAIDPGPVVSGVVLWDSEERRILQAWPEIPTPEVVEMVRDASMGVHLRVDIVACEMIASYGMAVGKEVFETCVQIGRISQEWERVRFASIRRIFRQQAKMHLCHSPKAKDANVSQALKDRFGEVGTKKNPGPLYGVSKHAWAALAVAVYAAEVPE